MAKRKKTHIPEDYESLQSKGERLEALIKLSNDLREKERRIPIHFNDFLYMCAKEPQLVFRNIFQFINLKF